MSSNLNDTNCTVWLQTLEIELTDLKENAINIVKLNLGETLILFALHREVVAGGWEWGCGCRGYIYVYNVNDE